jgi:Protein of unknown function (DUF3102)
MAIALLDRVRSLANDGHSDHYIAKQLRITRHKARTLLAKEYVTSLPAVIDIEPRTAAEYADRITQCWRKSVEAIFEVGRLLIRAKDSLQHGQFESMIEGSLPFGSRTARMLMSIANDSRLTDRNHGSVLPCSWRTLYELTKLSDSEFKKGIKSGVICPDMERKVLINGSRALMASRNGRDDEARDFYATPPWATRALIEVVLPSLLVRDDSWFGVSIWEPACGEGHISHVLEDYGAPVLSTDIVDYHWGQDGVADFLSEEIQYTRGPALSDWIITNPPFKDDLAERFTIRALDLARVGVAMFVRVQFLETIGRYENIFRDRPPTLLAFFVERVPLCMGRWDPDGGTATAYCWLVWLKDRAPLPPFWIPPGQRERLTREDDRERFAAWSLKGD